MRFLFVAPRYHSNMYFLFKGLIGSGHHVSLVSIYRGKLEDYDDIVTPKVLGYSPLFLFFSGFHERQKVGYLKTNFELKYGFSSASALWRAIRDTRPDVVIIKNIASLQSLIAAILAKLAGKRVVFQLQIDKYRAKERSWSITAVGVIFGAKVITPILGDPSRYRNKNKNLIYAPFVIEPIDHDRLYFRGGLINLLAVGKFVPRKNHLLLLGTFAELVGRHPLHLTIVGERADPQYADAVEKYITDHGLGSSVTVKYNLGFKEMLSEYEHHDLFILTSSDEPAAVSLLEAMSRGLAVVSSSANGTRCYIEEGKNGFVFRDKDELDLKNKLENLIGSKEMLERFGQYSLSLVRDNHQFIGFTLY